MVGEEKGWCEGRRRRGNIERGRRGNAQWKGRRREEGWLEYGEGGERRSILRGKANEQGEDEKNDERSLPVLLLTSKFSEVLSS